MPTDKVQVNLRGRKEDVDRWRAAAKADGRALNNWLENLANIAARDQAAAMLAQQPTLRDLLASLAGRGYGEKEERELLMAADQVLPEGRAATRKLLPEEVAALRRRWAKIDGLRKQGEASGAEA